MIFSKCGARKDSWEFLGLQGNQTSQSERKSSLNIHWKDLCWSWSSNILATWCEGPTHWEMNLILGKTDGKRRRGQQRMRWLDSISKLMDMNLYKLWEIVEDRGAWLAEANGVAKSQTQLNDWTATTTEIHYSKKKKKREREREWEKSLIEGCRASHELWWCKFIMEQP